MTAHASSAPQSPAGLRLGPLFPVLVKAGGITAGVGLLLAIVAGLMAGDQLVRFAHSYLLAYTFSLSLLLGAQLFVLIQYLTGAGWATSIRRIPEILSGLLPVWCLLGLPLLFFLGHLYPWASPEGPVGAHGPAEGFKAAMMTPFAFGLRLILYFAVWSFFGYYYLRKSVEQDKTGSVETTLHLQRLSPVATIVWALSVSFFSFDAIMSLDAHWHSTIFGIYFFSGCMVGALAVIVLLTWFLERSGRIRGAVNVHHYHDLGKLLFAFNMFWAYIAFSQYMLVWYANIPSETSWYAVRLHGSWQWAGLLLLVGHFLIPFLGLMSRGAKRRPGLLVFWSVWLLVMHLIDTWWLIVPPLSPGQISFSFTDLGWTITFIGLLSAGFGYAARQVPLVAERDPRLPEALTHATT